MCEFVMNTVEKQILSNRTFDMVEVRYRLLEMNVFFYFQDIIQFSNHMH